MAYSSDLVAYWNWARDGNNDLNPDDPSLGPKMEIVRQSPGFYFKANGRLAEAPGTGTGTPAEQDAAVRIDHHPLTGERRGLLVENSATQTLRQSNSFLTGSWQFTGNAIQQSAFEGLEEGVLAFEKENDAGQRAFTQAKPGGVSLADNQIWTFSIYVRRPAVDTGTFFRLDLNVTTASGSNVNSLCANQYTGVIEFAGVVSGADIEHLDARMEPAGPDVGGGNPQWWRASITGRISNSPSNWSFQVWPARGADGTAPGGGVIGNEGVFLVFERAQAERRSGVSTDIRGGPTSWIESAAAENITRQADVVSTTDMSWYPTGGPVTYFLNQEWYDETFGGVLNPGGPIVSQVSGADTMWLRTYSASTTFANPFGGSVTNTYQPSPIEAQAPVRIAGGFASGDSAVYIEGTGATSAASSGANGAKTALHLFYAPTFPNNRNLGGWVKEIRFYDTRRADTGPGSLDEMSQGNVPEDPGVPPVAGNPYQMLI